jgi:ABC-type sugar transport system ATPase subunit
VEVGAKAAVCALLDNLGSQGLAVMRLRAAGGINLSTRILVMRNGRMAGELSRQEAPQKAVLRLIADISGEKAV